MPKNKSWYIWFDVRTYSTVRVVIIMPALMIVVKHSLDLQKLVHRAVLAKRGYERIGPRPWHALSCVYLPVNQSINVLMVLVAGKPSVRVCGPNGQPPIKTYLLGRYVVTGYGSARYYCFR